MSESAGNYTIKIKTEKEGDALEKTAADLKDVGKDAQGGVDFVCVAAKELHSLGAGLRVLPHVL